MELHCCFDEFAVVVCSFVCSFGCVWLLLLLLLLLMLLLFGCEGNIPLTSLLILFVRKAKQVHLSMVQVANQTRQVSNYQESFICLV